jgi:hypothetical protein
MPAELLAQLKRSAQDVRFTYVFADEAQAKAFSRTRGGQDDKGDVCLVDGGDATSLDNGQDEDDGEAEARDWPGSSSSMVSLQFEANPAPDTAAEATLKSIRSRGRRRSRSDVHVLHAERFVSGPDGQASLAITDAWIDARSRGVRLLGRSTLPLSRVFVGPNGLEVYAARDGDAVQVVLHAPQRPSADAALADQLRPRLRSMAVTLPDRSGGSTDCGHLRFVLHSTAGGGEMGVLQSTAFLPPVDGDFGATSDGESEEGRGSRMLQAMRQRSFQLGVSATESSVDKSPVLSISLGWIGRERVGG